MLELQTDMSIIGILILVIVLPIIAIIMSLLAYSSIRKLKLQDPEQFKKINDSLNKMQETLTRLDEFKQDTRIRVDELDKDIEELNKELPRYNDIDDIKKKVESIEKTQNTFFQELNEKMAQFKLTYSKEIDEMRNDILRLVENKAKELTQNYIESESVSKDEFDRLRERIENLIGADELTERMDILCSIFNSKDIKTIIWQCRLINLLRGGLAPEAEEDILIQAGIPKTRIDAFLKRLLENGITEAKNVTAYYINPEFEWIYSYIDKPDWLYNRLRDYTIKEQEYKRYIRNNIALVDNDLIIVSEEYQVDSGYIDILCRDMDGKTCIIELKYPVAVPSVVGQLLRYKEDYKNRTGENLLRCILVAPKITDRTKESLNNHGFEYKEIEYNSPH